MLVCLDLSPPILENSWYVVCVYIYIFNVAEECKLYSLFIKKIYVFSNYIVLRNRKQDNIPEYMCIGVNIVF